MRTEWILTRELSLVREEAFVYGRDFDGKAAIIIGGVTRLEVVQSLRVRGQEPSAPVS